jgi:AmmeMemoRadiSam system protein A
MADQLTDREKQILLHLGRDAMDRAVKRKESSKLDINSLTPRLRENGASFVTITIHDVLRGCIGALEAYQPLANDVREHAIAAALQDPRFPPVVESELTRIRLEVSCLTTSQLLEYSSGEDLLVKLNPHKDGVVLKDGHRRATFLPQVWEKIPDPADFLDHLCDKMGARKNLWRDTKLQVYVYQVEEFREIHN